MQQFLDFVPIVVFVAVYYLEDIFWATGALMIAVTLQLVLMWALKRGISKQLKLTFWISLVLGGLTLFFRDNTFILWKPTIVNWLMSMGLLASHFIGRHNIVQRFLGQQLTLPISVWTRLNFGWAAGFFLAGALNLVVAYNFSEAFWVSYKLIGGFLITFCYIVATVVYLHVGGYLKEADDEAEDPESARLAQSEKAEKLS